MIRRLTITCGLLTLAVVAVLMVHDHGLFGGGASRRGAASVTAIPDQPASWPPVRPLPPAPPLKGLPPAPQPEPLHHRSAQAPPVVRTTVQDLGAIARTLLNLPKILEDQTQVGPAR